MNRVMSELDQGTSDDQIDHPNIPAENASTSKSIADKDLLLSCRKEASLKLQLPHTLLAPL